jgi:uncharacterized protein (TIRG00374 family)
VKSLQFVAGLAISAIVLGVMLWRVDLRLLGEHLSHTHWAWAAATGALALLGIWARARRWHYLFPPHSHPPALTRAAMIGYMANNVLPLRAGEVIRVYVVARHWNGGFWLPLATVVVERVLDGLTLVALLGALVALAPVPTAVRWTAAVFLTVDLVAVLALVGVAVAPDATRRVAIALTTRWPRLERKLVDVLDTFGRGLVGVRTASHLLPLLLWTAMAWLIPTASAWTAMLAAGLTPGAVAALAVITFVGFGISVPSAPGYIGVFHAAVVLALRMFGVPEEAALGYAVVFHASGFIPVTLLGWILALREHISLGEARQTRVTA